MMLLNTAIAKRAKQAGVNEFPARVFLVVVGVLDPVRPWDSRRVL
jgi:hypothetical protein